MDWKKINSSQFEKLSCRYAKNNYSDFDWKPTPASWDGNRDGEFSFEIDSIHKLIKGWYESKYTEHPEKSIPHSHMDSTLVSGILDGQVVYILFITNGKITNDFKRRANAVLRPYKIDVNFVDGEILEEWLLSNEDIYFEFFEDKNQTFINYLVPKIDIEDVCFFDCILSSPSLIEPIPNLLIGNEYYLYIGVQSNKAFDCVINLNNNCLKLFSSEISRVNKFIQIGYNSIYIKCQASDVYNGKLNIKIKSKNEDFFATYEYSNFIIKENYSPKIFYASQMNAIQQMYDYVQAECSDNTVMSVSGPEGSGKSYLQRKLIESLSKENYDCLTLQLSEKKAENACSLCQLILYLNFGYLFKLSEEAFFEMISQYANLPIDLFSKLREGTTNQIIALQAINEVVCLNKNNEYALMPMCNAFARGHVSYIFIDDLHKLDNEHSVLVKELLSEFHIRKFSQVLILGYRSNEFREPFLENIINEHTQKNWILGQLSHDDMKDTLSHEFNGSIGELSTLFSQPLNVLHLVMLVKQLRKKDIIKQVPLRAAKIFSDAYNSVNEQNNQFAINKIKNVKYLKEVYLIYVIETGIPKKLLLDFWGEGSQHIFNELFIDGIIKESGEYILPFHDAYLYAFRCQEYPTSLSDELIKFLNFIKNSNYYFPKLESCVISVLVSKNTIFQSNFKESARQYCKEYYNNANYYSAKILAKSLLPNIDVFNTELFSDDLIEILYIYAQSVKFTESHAKSTAIFKKIIQLVYKNELNPLTRDIGLDALSEVLNNEMWMLNSDEVNKCIKKLCRIKPSTSTTSYGENAYLNYLNRKMMCESFFGVEDFHTSYEMALSESVRLHRNDYEAYAKMDQARILYTTTPQKSLQLLNEAEDIFKNHNKFYRRLLECKAEKAFLKSILYGESIDELYSLQKEMLSQGYINSYTKTTIKILTIEAQTGIVSTEMIEFRIKKLILQNPDSLINKRNSMSIYQLMSLCAFIEKNEAKLNVLCNKHLDAVSKMNESYKRIPENNLKCSVEEQKIYWVLGGFDDIDGFWLDSRLW